MFGCGYRYSLSNHRRWIKSIKIHPVDGNVAFFYGNPGLLRVILLSPLRAELSKFPTAMAAASLSKDGPASPGLPVSAQGSGPNGLELPRALPFISVGFDSMIPRDAPER
jgi:hypothetical protein